MPTFLEFFAGGGMARAGLGPEWSCVFANDFDEKKVQSYRLNWGDDTKLRLEDISRLDPNAIPSADLAWASFPCQDLSLAGYGAGLNGTRSGTFFAFWHLIKTLDSQKRAPNLVVLENVTGTITSHNGKDFEQICSVINKAGYRFGGVVIDAEQFLPQSRCRLFFICVKDNIRPKDALSKKHPSGHFHTKSLIRAVEKLDPSLQKNWIWWDLPSPRLRTLRFADLIDENPTDVRWHTNDETDALIRLMSSVNLAKIEAAKRENRRMVGSLYRRTRIDESGAKVQRAEVRFDDVSGCIRTPAGGSSRQVIIVVDGPKIRSRLISARETARLMGLPESYKLPERYNDAYQLTGDGVAVPVVEFIRKNILDRIIIGRLPDMESAA